MTTSRLSIEEQMLEAERHARLIAAERERIERAADQRAADIRAARDREMAAAQAAAAIQARRNAEIEAAQREAIERAAAQRAADIRAAQEREMAAAQSAAAFEGRRNAEIDVARRAAEQKAANQRAADIRSARDREITAAQSAAALESSRTAQLDATRRETAEREAKARETAAASEMAAARTAAALESSHRTRTPSLAARLGAPPTPTPAPTALRPKPTVSRTRRLGEILSGEVPPELLAQATAPAPSRPRPGGLEMAAASFQQESDVRARNAALRRAYDVVPGGPEVRAAIDDLVAGSRSAPITRSPSTPRSPSTQRAPGAPAARLSPGAASAQEHLVEERSRDRENRAIASTLPRGREAYDSFKREQELVELNGALRREILADPGGAAFLATIDGQTAAPPRLPTADEEARRFEAAFDRESTPEQRFQVRQQRAAVRDREIRAIASGIPGALESYEEALRQEPRRDAALRREILADPSGAAFLNARDAQVAATKLRLQDVVPEFAPQALRRSQVEQETPRAEGGDPVVPERLVDLYKNRRDLAGFNEGELAYAGQFSNETLTIAQLIAEYEAFGRLDEAEGLRGGGPIPKTGQIPGVTEARNLLRSPIARGVQRRVEGTIASSPIGNLAQTTFGVGGELLDGDIRGAGDQLGIGFAELARDAILPLRLTDPLFRGDRGRPDSAIEAHTDNLLDLFEDVQRPGGGVVKALTPEGSRGSIITDPGATLRRLGEGFAAPRETSGRDTALVDWMSDRNVIGPFSPRDFGGLAVELAADPTNYIPGVGLADDALRLGGKADDLVRSVRRLLRGSDDLVPPQIVKLDDPVSQRVLRAMRDGGSIDEVERAILVTRLSGNVPLQGSMLVDGSASQVLDLGVRSTVGVDELAAGLTRETDELLDLVVSLDPEAAVASPQTARMLRELLDGSSDAYVRELSDLTAALPGWEVDGDGIIRGLLRIGPVDDPGEFERLSLLVVSENVRPVRIDSGGFVPDFAQLAARAEARVGISRQLLAALTSGTTHAVLREALEAAILKGGVEAAEALLGEVVAE